MVINQASVNGTRHILIARPNKYFLELLTFRICQENFVISSNLFDDFFILFLIIRILCVLFIRKCPYERNSRKITNSKYSTVDSKTRGIPNAVVTFWYFGKILGMPLTVLIFHYLRCHLSLSSARLKFVPRDFKSIFPYFLIKNLIIIRRDVKRKK